MDEARLKAGSHARRLSMAMRRERELELGIGSAVSCGSGNEATGSQVLRQEYRIDSRI